MELYKEWFVSHVGEQAAVARQLVMFPKLRSLVELLLLVLWLTWTGWPRWPGGLCGLCGLCGPGGPGGLGGEPTLSEEIASYQRHETCRAGI